MENVVSSFNSSTWTLDTVLVLLFQSLHSFQSELSSPMYNIFRRTCLFVNDNGKLQLCKLHPKLQVHSPKLSCFSSLTIPNVLKIVTLGTEWVSNMVWRGSAGVRGGTLREDTHMKITWRYCTEDWSGEGADTWQKNQNWTILGTTQHRASLIDCRLALIWWTIYIQ